MRSVQNILIGSDHVILSDQTFRLCSVSDNIGANRIVSGICERFRRLLDRGWFRRDSPMRMFCATSNCLADAQRFFEIML